MPPQGGKKESYWCQFSSDASGFSVLVPHYSTQKHLCAKQYQLHIWGWRGRLDCI